MLIFCQSFIFLWLIIIEMYYIIFKKTNYLCSDWVFCASCGVGKPITSSGTWACISMCRLLGTCLSWYLGDRANLAQCSKAQSLFSSRICSHARRTVSSTRYVGRSTLPPSWYWHGMPGVRLTSAHRHEPAHQCRSWAIWMVADTARVMVSVSAGMTRRGTRSSARHRASSPVWRPYVPKGGTARD